MSHETTQLLSLALPRKRTRQRHQILRIIKGAIGPLSADEIFQRARQSEPGIGLATVYRTLKILRDKEQVRAIALPDGLARYESLTLGRQHFQCRICREIWTLPTDPIPSVRALKPHNGFVIEDHDSVFYGRCANCQTPAVETA